MFLGTIQDPNNVFRNPLFKDFCVCVEEYVRTSGNTIGRNLGTFLGTHKTFQDPRNLFWNLSGPGE